MVMGPNSKFKGLFVSDFHLRSRVPPSRKTYLSDFELKWDEICQMAKDLEVDAIGLLQI